MTPYYSDTMCHIWHDDALDVMREIPSDSVDVVITSPPYNMGLVPGGNGRGMYKPGPNAKAGRFRDGYGIHGDAMEQSEYDAWQRECLAEMWRLARLAVYYNHRPRVEHGVLRWPLGLDFGIPLRQVIIWDRGTGIDVNLRSYCTRQEHISPLTATCEWCGEQITHSGVWTSNSGGDYCPEGQDVGPTGTSPHMPEEAPSQEADHE